MDRLFRDWRYALLWVIGISAIAAAYSSQGGSDEDLLAKPPSEATIQPQAAAASPAQAATQFKQDGEESANFGEPVMDTTGLDPNPPESGHAEGSESQDAGPASPEANSPAPEAL